MCVRTTLWTVRTMEEPSAQNLPPGPVSTVPSSAASVVSVFSYTCVLIWLWGGEIKGGGQCVFVHICICLFVFFCMVEYA